MNRIVERRTLSHEVALLRVEAPAIARKAAPGQFIIFRLDERGERVPLTIADFDRAAGTITLVFRTIGRSTKMLANLDVGDDILDLAGPLGRASHLAGIRRACVIGGGVGCAIAYPQAKALHALGAKVDIIAGYRSQDVVILAEEMRAVCDHFYPTTDDGSYGEAGLVTDKLKALLDGGTQYDAVIAVGPVRMMKYVSATTAPYGIKTIVSLNPIMVDGTGMCGGCRVTVGGKMQFACVDGPDFDGQLVDFDELLARNGMYKAAEADHACRLLKGGELHA